MGTRIKSASDLYNLIGTVVLCAPDRFAVRDYLAPDEQMTLDRAFNHMRDAIDTLYPEDHFNDKRSSLAQALDGALSAYRDGDRYNGAHRLQDFQDMIFQKG
jgi:hypothetical protein